MALLRPCPTGASAMMTTRSLAIGVHPPKRRPIDLCGKARCTPYEVAAGDSHSGGRGGELLACQGLSLSPTGPELVLDQIAFHDPTLHAVIEGGCYATPEVANLDRRGDSTLTTDTCRQDLLDGNLLVTQDR